MKINNNMQNFRANKMSEIQARTIDSKLKNSKKVDIICHESSDRDTLNSALAMWEYLNNQGVSARVIMDQNLNLLKLRKTNCEFVQSDDSEKIGQDKADCILCVDFSAKDRINPYILRRIKNSKKLIGLDHHKDPDITDNFINITKTIEDADKIIQSKTNYYIDSSAKSATSVVYRFFEALNYNINKNTAYDLFYGLVDDCSKKRLVKCDGVSGTITPSKELTEDKNAFEVYTKLKGQLSEREIKRIAKNTDVLSSMTKQEKAFYEKLKQNTKQSKNKKIAYVEIEANNPTWEKLGGDNTRTSRILNVYRQKMLEDYPEAKVAICFYQAGSNYRLSAHSRDKNLLDFFKYIDETKMKGFSENSGGHQDRGGGKIATTNPQSCHKWAEEIVSCDDFYDKY